MQVQLSFLSWPTAALNALKKCISKWRATFVTTKLMQAALVEDSDWI